MGSSGGFEVTASSLDEKRGQLQADNKALKEQIQALQRSEKTLSGKWEGNAKETFENAFNKDIGQMDKFTALIDKYVTTLDQIIKNYSNAEKTNTRTASSRTYNS